MKPGNVYLLGWALLDEGFITRMNINSTILWMYQEDCRKKCLRSKFSVKFIIFKFKLYN